VAAVDLIAEGKYDRMVSWQNRQVVSVPIAEAIAQYRAVDPKGTQLKRLEAWVFAWETE